MNTNSSIVVFKRGDLTYSLQVRLGLVNRVGSLTPKKYLGKEFKQVGIILTGKGFKISKIII